MVTVVRIVAVAALLALIPPTTTVIDSGHAPDLLIRHSQSKNWSGIAVTGHGPYTSVSARWVQPAVNCQQTPRGFSAFWVGLDGDGTSSVEQTGTEADCRGGVPSYSAWYEMYPKPSVTFSDPVAPNDRMSASVTAQGGGAFQLVLTDSTQGWTRTVNARSSSAALGSAEVIAEAPSNLILGLLPLADFGSITFTNTTVNGSTPTAATPGIEPITMATTGGTVKAKPTMAASGGFVDTWFHQ